MAYKKVIAVYTRGKIAMEMSGAEFRQTRKKIGKTQAQLALTLGCTRQHIGDLEDRAAVPAYMALAIRQLVVLEREAA